VVSAAEVVDAAQGAVDAAEEALTVMVEKTANGAGPS